MTEENVGQEFNFSSSSEREPQIEESEIKELKTRIERLEGQLEREKTPEEKEKLVKKEIKDYLQELQETPSGASPVNLRDEADEIKKFPSSQQVGALISLVFDKGLKKAIAVARELDNPAILDEFHDVLVDRYYQELIKRKILKPW